MKMVIQQINDTGEVYPGQSITLVVLGSYNDVYAHNALTGTAVHGLGTASTADVTTGATDTTPGRLLKVGDFGIGSNCVVLSNGTDLDIVTFTGFYMGEALLHAPTTGGCYIEVFHHGGAGYTYQRAISVTESIPVVYERTSTAGIWHSWSRQINQENILTSGKPTVSLERNAIIERGSNANGEYVKFADGTGICWKTVPISYINGFLLGATWTLPVLFTDLDYSGILSVANNYSTGLSDTARGKGNLYFSPGTGGLADVGIFSNGSFVPGEGGLLRCTAIGRWF